MEQLAALGINLGFLVSQIINFIILMALLNFVAYKPLLNMLEQRRERIRKGLEDARAAEERLANAEAEAQKLRECYAARNQVIQVDDFPHQTTMAVADDQADASGF